MSASGSKVTPAGALKTRACCYAADMTITRLLLLLVAVIVACPGHGMRAQQPGGSDHARGEFDIKMTMLPSDEQTQRLGAGRAWGDKQIRGDLEGTSQGYMLTATTDVKDSAAYVALERVDATLKGRKGTFIFQHSGWMRAGAQHLAISVVPDSATAELMGLAGTMTITIVGGKHFYDFAYTLPD
jgi:hypothetical protein